MWSRRPHISTFQFEAVCSKLMCYVSFDHRFSSFFKGLILQGSQLRDEPARPHVPGRFSADIKFTSFDTGPELCLVSLIRSHQLIQHRLPTRSGYPATGNGFFAQDLNEKALRSETLRPFPGTEQLLTNMTSLNHSCTF